MKDINLKGKSLLTLKDYSKEEIRYLLFLSSYLKTKKTMGVKDDLLKGKNIVLLFEKNSTRTRCAFEVAAYDEGANVTYIGPNDCHMGKKESIEDTAKVLGQFYDGIEFRGFKQETVETLANYSNVPVWNGLTDMYHPTQILADFMTIVENCNKPLEHITFVYVGDARSNMGNSLMIGCAKMGIKFIALAPKSLWPNEELVKEMKIVAKKSRGSITLTNNIDDVKNVDVIYTDVWVSMGEEEKYEERINLLKNYQVNLEMVKRIGKEETIFLHCLPAFHDLNTKVGKEIYIKYNLKELEVSDEVFNSKYSKVFEQSQNRMHTIKAIMVATMSEFKLN